MTQKVRKRQTIEIGEDDGERARRGATETVRKSGVKTGERERKGDGVRGKKPRNEREKALPRNHAPRSPTDFYVQTDGEGKHRDSWDGRLSAR